MYMVSLLVFVLVGVMLFFIEFGAIWTNLDSYSINLLLIFVFDVVFCISDIVIFCLIVLDICCFVFE